MPGNWHHIPFVRYLIPLITGVLIALHWDQPHAWCYPLFFAITLAYFLLGFFTGWKVHFRWQILFGVALQCMLIVGGLALTQYKTTYWRSDYFMQGADSNSVFTCRLIKPPTIGARSIKLEMQVEGRWDDGDYIATTGNTIIYMRKDSDSIELPHYGDIMLMGNIFTMQSPPKNPGAFDFAKYLKSIGIAHIAWCEQDALMPTETRAEKWWWKWIFAAREMFHRAVMRDVKDVNAQTVGEALVIGTKTDIDPEVQQAYANTGTLHVLAVSGLHVGILFAVLEFILSPIPWFKKSNKGKVTKYIIVLILIWWYACLSGSSASVNRSAVMFSCLATGKLFDRQNNTFNILFVSMFILIIDDPACITQVGFQLSYLAVGGIVFFQPYLQKLWRPKQFVIKHIWTLSTVSVAAQLATSPISLFYFHQFPNYFLLSNLVAIPVSFIVLVLGLLFFVVNAIPMLGAATGMALDFSLRLLNGSVVAIDKLPGAVVDDIYISPEQLGLMYLAVFSLGAALFSRQGRYLIYTMVLFLGVMVSGWVDGMRRSETQRLVCYSVKGHDMVLLQSGGASLLLSDTLVTPESAIWKQDLRNDVLGKGDMPDFALFSLQEPPEGENGWLYRYPWAMVGNSVLFVLDPTSVHQLPISAPEADILYILGEPYLNLQDLQQRFPNATVVIGGNAGWKRHGYYLRTCRKLGIPVWSLRNDGALVLPVRSQ